MPVELFTGLPGSGKSLSIVQRLHQLKEKEPNRRVFVHGVDGLREGIAEKIDLAGVRAWRELPPNSIVVVDECQTVFPMRRSGDPPAFVRDLSLHRHDGIDFILSTQRPSYIDTYVRGLVSRHVHLARIDGGPKSKRYTWQNRVGDPDSKSDKKTAVVTSWDFPKEHFGDYKSAEVHTIKVKHSWLWYAQRALFAVSVIVIVGAVVVMKHLESRGSPAASSKPAVAAAPGRMADILPSPASSNGKVLYATPEAYAIAFTPRVVNQPWSAPAYDGDAIRSRPDIYCLEFQPPDGSKGQWCQCYTEQATRYHVPLKECEFVAREGVYNPHRPALQDQVVATRNDQARSQGTIHTDSQGVAGDAPAGNAPHVGARYDSSVFGPDGSSRSGNN